MEQSQGYILKGQESKVFKLQKSLDGLKQAPRAWYSRIDSYLQKEGLTKSHANFNFYFSFENKNMSSYYCTLMTLYLLAVIP